MNDDRSGNLGSHHHFRGRSSPSTASAPAHRNRHVESSFLRGRNLKQMSRGGTQKWVKRAPVADNPPIGCSSLHIDEEVSLDTTNLMETRISAKAVGSAAEQLELLSVSAVLSNVEKDFASSSMQSDPSNKKINARRSEGGYAFGGMVESFDSSHFVTSSSIDSASIESCSYPFSESGSNFFSKDRTQQELNSREKAGENERTENFEGQTLVVPYDICPEKAGTCIKLKASLHVKNREKRNENRRALEGLNIRAIRPGMVLLKGYISSKDQISIVKKCRELGLGFGGFYQPGYGDVAKLHLKMMCLGKHWEPEQGKYLDRRPIDDATPPAIPAEFCQLVKMAIQDSLAHLQRQYKAMIEENALPSMSPNICIVNFYTQSGHLGLHQDKDEGPESLYRGLPVVSFSIGDAAEFLYCDQRDTDKPDKVILESGDVLIFGGKSRNIFHGVANIRSGTSPATLLEETNLLSGRLNLTFREY